jgi:hypothetical protein
MYSNEASYSTECQLIKKKILLIPVLISVLNLDPDPFPDPDPTGF